MILLALSNMPFILSTTGLLVLLVLMMVVAIGLIGTIINKLDKLMATIADVVKDVADESTVIDGLAALISGLRQQINDLLSGANLPPAIQTQIDQAFTLAEQNKTALAAALMAGTTPAPGPTPTPEPSAPPA